MFLGVGMKRCTLVVPKRHGWVHLAIKKGKIGAGLYNGWGGKFEPEKDKSLLDTAVREFEEETSGAKVRPQDLQLVAIADFYQQDEHIFECYIYFCESWQGEIRESDQMGPPKAFRVGRMPYHQMMAADREWLDFALMGSRLRWKFFYDLNNTRVIHKESEPL